METIKKLSSIFLSLVGIIVGIILIIVGIVESSAVEGVSRFIIYGISILLLSIIAGLIRLSR